MEHAGAVLSHIARSPGHIPARARSLSTLQCLQKLGLLHLYLLYGGGCAKYIEKQDNIVELCKMMQDVKQNVMEASPEEQRAFWESMMGKLSAQGVAIPCKSERKTYVDVVQNEVNCE